MKSYVALFICVMSLTLAAQQPRRRRRRLAAPAAPTAPPRRRPPDPERGGQPINIRLDVSVIDQTAAGSHSAEVAHGHAGGSRDGSDACGISRSFGRRRCAGPTIVDGRIRVNLTIQSEQSRNNFPVNRSTPRTGSHDRLAQLVFAAARKRQADAGAGNDGRGDEAEDVDRSEGDDSEMTIDDGRSVRHRVQQHVDADRVAVDREVVEVARIV